MTTKTVSVADQLAKLTAAKDQAFAEVQKVKRERDAFDAETKALQAEHSVRHETYPEEYARDRNHLPLPGTDAEKIADTLKARMFSPNPVQPNLDAEIAKYHAAEIAERDFRIENLELLIDEVAPQSDVEKITAAWQTIAGLADNEKVKVDRVAQLLIDMPMFEGRDVTYDPRLQAWADMAADALESDLVSPRVADQVGWKLDQLRRQIEADRNE